MPLFFFTYAVISQSCCRLNQLKPLQEKCMPNNPPPLFPSKPPFEPHVSYCC